MSEKPAGERDERRAVSATLLPGVRDVRFRSHAPGQLVLPTAFPRLIAPSSPFTSPRIGGCMLVATLRRQLLHRPLTHRRREVDERSSGTLMVVRVGRRPGRERLRRARLHPALPTAEQDSSIWKTGCPFVRSSTHRSPALLGIARALMARPFTVMSASIAADDMS